MSSNSGLSEAGAASLWDLLGARSGMVAGDYFPVMCSGSRIFHLHSITMSDATSQGNFKQHFHCVSTQYAHLLWKCFTGCQLTWDRNSTSSDTYLKQVINSHSGKSISESNCLDVLRIPHNPLASFSLRGSPVILGRWAAGLAVIEERENVANIAPSKPQS